MAYSNINSTKPSQCYGPCIQISCYVGHALALVSSPFCFNGIAFGCAGENCLSWDKTPCRFRPAHADDHKHIGAWCCLRWIVIQVWFIIAIGRAGLALASSQVANGYQDSPLATEQRAGVAKLATGVCRSMWQVSSSEYLGVTYQKDTKDIGYWMRNLATTFRCWVAKMALLDGKPAPAQFTWFRGDIVHILY